MSDRARIKQHAPGWIPVEFFPQPTQWFAQAFPLTHGLAAIRGTIAGQNFIDLRRDVALCILTGVIWMTIAALTFERFAEAGRRDGSIEFGD